LTKDNIYKIVDNQLSNKIHPYYEILNNVPTKVGTYLAPELLKVILKLFSNLENKITIFINHQKLISLLLES